MQLQYRLGQQRRLYPCPVCLSSHRFQPPGRQRPPRPAAAAWRAWMQPPPRCCRRALPRPCPATLGTLKRHQEGRAGAIRATWHGCSSDVFGTCSKSGPVHTAQPASIAHTHQPWSTNSQSCLEVQQGTLTGHLLRRFKLLGLRDVQAQLEQLNLLAQLGQLGTGLDGLQEARPQLASKPWGRRAAQCNDPLCAATHVCMAKSCTFTSG